MNFKNQARIILNMFRKPVIAGMTMSFRLVFFLVVLVLLMTMGVAAALLISGFQTSGVSYAREYMENEISRISRNISVNFGDASNQLIRLSEALSKNIEFNLKNKGIAPENLTSRPDVLEEIIGNEIERLLYAMDRTNATGVFMVLDATVNPGLPDARYSKAGVSIRNTEPELSGPEMTKRYLRGFTGIAARNDFANLISWDLEFDVRNRLFYHLPIGKYNGTKAPLSRLYYWGFESIIAESGEAMILCGVPMVDSNGFAFGVCGFEISAEKFSRDYSPDRALAVGNTQAAGGFKNVFSVFSLINGNSLDIEKALFSSGHAASNLIRDKKPLFITEASPLNTYAAENGKQSLFMGLHREIKIYPDNSVFSGPRFAVAVLIPKHELDAITNSVNRRLILVCAALLSLGFCVSVFISRRYLKPILLVFNDIYSDQVNATANTNIQEIDRLLELIRERHGKDFKDQIGDLQSAAFDKLSVQELRIAELLLQGYSYTEIAKALKIQPNTVKWYQKSLYSKLQINSKRELFALARKKTKGGE